jgi:hypothetical protein
VYPLVELLVCLARKLIDKIEGLLDDIADDTLVQRGLEADLGLPEGALDNAKVKRPELTGIDEYINAVDADAEKLKVALESIKTYAKFWTTVFDAAKTEDPSIVADELVYRLFEYATVELMKFEHPSGYAFMRLLGVIQGDLRTTFEETLAPEVPGNIFTGDYWKAMPPALAKGYHNFRLDQAPDFVLEDPDEADPPLPPDEVVRRHQLGLPVFAWSDAGFLGFYILVWLSRWAIGDRNVKIDHLYGWELPFHPRTPPCLEAGGQTGIPISDHVASRGYSLRLSTTAGAPATSSATLTQFLLVDEEGVLGWLFSVRGAVTFEEKAGSKERPVKIAVKVEARDGLDALVRFSGDDQFSFTGAPDAAMRLAIAPVQAATAAPAIALPDATGTRLEIGDYSFSVDLSKDGFKIKAATKKSALVIVTGDADSFIEDSLGGKETRIEFDLGATADQNGVSLDGGGRLAATLPIDFSRGPIRIRELQLALDPASSPTGSELALTATGSFSFSLGPLKIVVEQIGMTFNIGSTRGSSPEGALELGTSLLYFRNAGFRPPSGIGIRVDGDFVSGGGFLFYDKDREEYAGVLQLDFGPRFTFTAIGLLTTKLPDGGKGYSFLIILSLELDPPWRVGPLGLGGLGGLFGLRRALDTDALRAGLRNRTLDAVLFPKDPVTNAGRLIAALRTVFPPARDRHVAGPILMLTWGAPTIVTAELALVFEWGTSSRRALIGQVHAAFPPKLEKKLIEINIDAIGIWDRQRGEFSLDARIYDSHIAFAKLSGDVALRMKSGQGSFFLFSAGGYHPEFSAPAHFPKLDRLKIVLADSESLKLIFTGYLALTSNTRQVGAEMVLFVGFKGVSIEALLSFDALFEVDTRFLVDFDVEVKLKYKGQTFFGVSVSGRFTGPEPKRVEGEWSIDLWLFSVSGKIDKTYGPDRPPLGLPSVDPLPDLIAALRDAHNWSAPLPLESRMMVSFRNRPGSAEVLVHPLGEIGVRQQLLPLGIDLDRYAGGAPQGQRRFAITKAFVGGRPLTQLRPVDEQFAAGDFLELTDDEKLHRPSFEAMPAGVTLQPNALAYGGQAPGTAGQAAVSEIDFEEVVVDADGNVVRSAGAKPLGPQVLTLAVEFGPAALSQLRAGGSSRFAAPGPAFAVGPERFAVAGVADLQHVAVDGLEETSHAAVRQALERHLKDNPQAQGTLQVVPAFRAGGPA